jgi:hypothetical protein
VLVELSALAEEGESHRAELRRLQAGLAARDREIAALRSTTTAAAQQQQLQQQQHQHHERHQQHQEQPQQYLQYQQYQQQIQHQHQQQQAAAHNHRSSDLRQWLPPASPFVHGTPVSAAAAGTGSVAAEDDDEPTSHKSSASSSALFRHRGSNGASSLSSARRVSPLPQLQRASAAVVTAAVAESSAAVDALVSVSQTPQHYHQQYRAHETTGLVPSASPLPSSARFSASDSTDRRYAYTNEQHLQQQHPASMTPAARLLASLRASPAVQRSTVIAAAQPRIGV